MVVCTNKIISKSLCTVLTMLALFSCEKAIMTEDGEEEVTKGNLKVSIFQIEQTPFASLTRTAVSEVCTRLNFAIYYEDGSRVKQINQKVGDANFGSCSFQLEEGTYQLVALAHSSNSNPKMTNPAKIQFTNADGYTDTFLYSDDVTIEEEPQELSVSLDRIVALCRFVITDDYPKGVAKMRFYYTGGSGAFNAATGLGSVNSQQTVTMDVASGQKQFDLYTFLHEPEDDISLKVTALDANDNILRERDFDVQMQRNHITWLSGAFFDGAASSSSSITVIGVNTDWDGETHLTF